MKKNMPYFYTVIIIALGGLYTYFYEWGELIALAMGITVCTLIYLKGFRTALMPVLLAAMLFYAIHGGWLATVFLLIGFLVPGSLAALALKKEYSFRSTMAAVSIGYLAEIMMGFLVIKFTKGINIFEATIDAIKQIMLSNENQMLSGLKEMGIQNPQELYYQMVDATVTYFKLLIPAFIVISACISAYIVIRLSVALLRWHDERLLNIIPFGEIRGGKRLALTAVLTFVLTTSTNYGLKGFFLNIFILLATYFAFCGIAVADYYLARKFVKLPFRLLLYMGAIGLTSWFALIAALIVGLIDAFADLRRMKTRGETDEE